ncbi:MAG: iron-containing alcohol dehydrogenase, partial [Planctomycetota bacterium]
QPRTRVVFGPGSARRLGELAKEYGGKRVLLVSDQGVVDAGHFETGRRSLVEAGLEVHAFHDFAENPTTAMVDAGTSVAAEFQPDMLVGLGGGSSMDCCKGINFVYSCGGSMHDYHGVGKATTDMLPMIAVPTTSGTGSEAQSFALISDAETHVKMACGDARAACRVALLDPELTLTQPRRVTAVTGIDALSHAIETYVTKRRSAISQTFSKRAFQLIATGLPGVLTRPDDLGARGQMQLGACLAGMAIETSMLGAAHATANPLTARFDVVHGQAVGVMLQSVIRMNGRQHADCYAELLREVQPDATPENAPQRLSQFVGEMLAMADMATTLSELNVDTTAFEDMSEDATRQWTGTFNPVELNRERILGLYQDVA